MANILMLQPIAKNFKKSFDYVFMLYIHDTQKPSGHAEDFFCQKRGINPLKEPEKILQTYQPNDACIPTTRWPTHERDFG
jgi:hypothetical protein